MPSLQASQAKHDPHHDDASACAFLIAALMSECRPVLRALGMSGFLVSFAATYSDAANRAALALRARLESEQWDGVEETSNALTSVFIRFDPLAIAHDRMAKRLAQCLAATDWRDMPLPPGRKLWRIPLALGGKQGPQFSEAAAAAGLQPDKARAELAQARLRVLTIGFAPGQPYMGSLSAAWDIPRATKLNPQVPRGALVVALRQLIIFAAPAPTGWRHVGQTPFRCFRPEKKNPFALAAGDEVCFRLTDAADLARISAQDKSGDGGADWEKLP